MLYTLYVCGEGNILLALPANQPPRQGRQAQTAWECFACAIPIPFHSSFHSSHSLRPSVRSLGGRVKGGGEDRGLGQDDLSTAIDLSMPIGQAAGAVPGSKVLQNDSLSIAA